MKPSCGALPCRRASRELGGFWESFTGVVERKTAFQGSAEDMAMKNNEGVAVAPDSEPETH